MNNPIIKEVRKARAALAAELGHNRQKVFEWAKAAYAARNLAANPTSKPRRKATSGQEPRLASR